MADASVKVDDNKKMTRECSYVLEKKEDEVVKKEPSREEIVGAMRDEERELYDLILANYDELEREDVGISYFIPREMGRLINSKSFNYEFMKLFMNGLPNFNFRTYCEEKKVQLWPEGNIYRIVSHTTNNVVLILPNGCLLIDVMKKYSSLSTNFKKYVEKLIRNYSSDVIMAKKTFGKSVEYHGLDEYYFVPYMDDDVLKLHLPILREHPRVTNMKLEKFVKDLLY